MAKYASVRETERETDRQTDRERERERSMYIRAHAPTPDTGVVSGTT